MLGWRIVNRGTRMSGARFCAAPVDCAFVDFSISILCVSSECCVVVKKFIKRHCSRRVVLGDCVVIMQVQFLLRVPIAVVCRREDSAYVDKTAAGRGTAPVTGKCSK